MLASSAFPGVYPPVHFDGRTFIDGGVVADVPLDITLALGVATALVLSVPSLRCRRPADDALDILFRASSLGVEAHGRTMLRRPPAGLDSGRDPRPSVEAHDVRRRHGRRT